MQCIWVSHLVSSQFGQSNTGTSCLERLWSVFKTWLDTPGQPALADPASAWRLDQMISRGPCQPQPFWDLGFSALEQMESRAYAGVWKYSVYLNSENAFSFISYQVQFLSGLLWTICFPCFCFQVCFIQHECSHHLH